MSPIVTVLVPVFNGLPYLKETVESVLAQSMSSFELVLIDDASTDGTAQFISQLNDPRIRCVYQPKNVGMTPNWEFARQLVNAKYFCVLGADDVFEPDHLERKVALLEKYPQSSLVHGAMFIIDERGNQIRVESYECPEYCDPATIGPILVETAVVNVTSALYRTESMQKSGVRFEERYKLIPDWPFFLQLALKCGGVAYDPKPTARYRVHSNSVSRSSMKSFRWTYEYRQVRLDTLINDAARWKQLGVDPDTVGSKISRDLLPVCLQQVRIGNLENAKKAFASYAEFNSAANLFTDLCKYVFNGCNKAIQNVARLLRRTPCMPLST